MRPHILIEYMRAQQPLPSASGLLNIIGIASEREIFNPYVEIDPVFLAL
jgi:type II secretory pathway component PulK